MNKLKFIYNIKKQFDNGTIKHNDIKNLRVSKVRLEKEIAIALKKCFTKYVTFNGSASELKKLSLLSKKLQYIKLIIKIGQAHKIYKRVNPLHKAKSAKA